MQSDLFLLGSTMCLGLEKVNELCLLGDGPLHFHLLMRVYSLQVELSEHHYSHEFLLKYFISHREGDRETKRQGGECHGVKHSVCVCRGSEQLGKNKTKNDTKI